MYVGPLVSSNAFVSLSIRTISFFIPNICAYTYRPIRNEKRNDIVYTHTHIGRYICGKVAKSSRKCGFGAPDFFGEGVPQISDIHFQIALTFEHVAGFA